MANTFKQIIHRFDRTNCRMTEKYMDQMIELTEVGKEHLNTICQKLMNRNGLKGRDNFEHLEIFSKKNPIEQQQNLKQSSTVLKKYNEKIHHQQPNSNDAINDQIIKNIKQMRLENQQHHSNINHSDNLLVLDQDYKNKTIAELIELSNRKVNLLNKQNHNLQNLMDEEDQGYPLTDYSSNQSSNENNYDDIEFKDEVMSVDDQPLFGGMFSKNMYTYENDDQSQKSCPQIFSFQPFKKHLNEKIGGYIPQDLLKSPKKSLKKRMYIRQKRIPLWAEDFNELNTKVSTQNIQKGKNIFGVFIAENLNSNLLFSTNENYIRTSSAKWNKEVKRTQKGYLM